jgi:hypothetical protein
MEEQLEYVLYANLFMEESQLTLNLLNGYIHSSDI